MFFYKIFNNSYINEVNTNKYVILIQSTWRMYNDKKIYNKKKNSAKLIQKTYKKYKFRSRRSLYKNKLNELIVIENNINNNIINNKLHNDINKSVDDIMDTIINDAVNIYNKKVNCANNIVNKYDNKNSNLKNRKVNFNNKIDYINKNYNSILNNEYIEYKNNSNNINLNDVIIDINDYRKDYCNYLNKNYNYDEIKKYEKYDKDMNCLSIMKNTIKTIGNNILILKDCLKFDIENNQKNLNRQYNGHKYCDNMYKRYNYKYGTFVDNDELEYLNNV